MNILALVIALFGNALLHAQQTSVLIPDPIVSIQTTQEAKEVASFGDLENVQSRQAVEPIAETPKVDESAELIKKLQGKLKTKEVVIDKLTLHLESALRRLNALKSDHQTPAETSVAMAARDKAQRKATQLVEEVDRLNSELAMLRKQKQLLDLENRQLFHALNGVERTKKSPRFSKASYTDASKFSSNDSVVNYR